MDFKYQKDRIIAQCASCGRIRRVISDWSKEKHEQNIKFAKVICPDCSPKPSESKEEEKL